MRQKHYLEAAAWKLQDSCPGQARYLLWAYSSSHGDKSTFEGTCPYCFQLLVQDKSRVITCKTCNRTVKHHGKSRSFLSTLKSNPTTPASKLSLKTPERKTLSSAILNHDMSGSKAKSPALIFRRAKSGQSTPICSSKNVSKTKKHFSQLKMLLSQSESKKNPKVDFRNFLSSL